jgi:hypothetical protein
VVPARESYAQAEAAVVMAAGPSPQSGFNMADGTLVMRVQRRMGRQPGETFATLMISKDHRTTWTVRKPGYSGGNKCQAALVTHLTFTGRPTSRDRFWSTPRGRTESDAAVPNANAPSSHAAKKNPHGADQVQP